MCERDGFMDEYRGRHHGYDRREDHQHHHHEEPAHAHVHAEHVSPAAGIFPGLGIGGDFLDEYLPIILIILGAVGVYLLLNKNGGLGGLGGLLGGFLK